MSTSSATSSLAATLGLNIRQARKEAGFTQHELAVALSSGDAMTISRWERGVHRPSDTNLVQLAEVLKREVSWFYETHAMPSELVA